MFSRIISICFFLFFVVPLLASATVIPRDGDCNTGAIQCCNTIQNATPTVIGMLSGLLGTVLGPVTGLIGRKWIPIWVAMLSRLGALVGMRGRRLLNKITSDCSEFPSSAQPVCCTNNSFGGLVALGCMPININL
ncbi:fungal hydrophobin-domain-containing protein [Infundibulicybe gibba]|nr:fungal hydrophobin-domain-containing protein [Infundibulicybe gibba]